MLITCAFYADRTYMYVHFMLLGCACKTDPLTVANCLNETVAYGAERIIIRGCEDILWRWIAGDSIQLLSVRRRSNADDDEADTLGSDRHSLPQGGCLVVRYTIR